MSHCVPDWDGHGGELDAILISTDYLPPVQGRQSSDVPAVWTENGSVSAKPQGIGGKNPDWQASRLNVREQETEDAVTPSKPPTSEPLKDGILAMNVPVVDSMNSTLLVDDEMVSWLQYPLDDSLEKSYCSEFFGELPNSTVNSMRAIKDSLAVGQSTVGRNNCRIMPPVNGGMTGNQNRVVSADAAMAMGAGRAAGVLPQAGVEAFTTVRTQQPYSGKWSPPNSSSSPTKTLGATAPSLGYGQRTPPLIPSTSTSLCPPPKTYPVPLQPAIARKGTMNFSHFSIPAVNMKANLQYLGVSHTNLPAQNRVKTPYLPTVPNGGSRPFDTCTSSGSSIAESTTTGLHSEGSRIELHAEGSDGHQPATLATESKWPTSIRDPLPASSKNAQEPATNSTIVGNNHVMTGNNHVDTESRPADVENPQKCTSSMDTSNTSQGTDKCVSQVPELPELPELPEPTLTSSSGGSGNSGKGGAIRGKRRTRDPEESEAQSDDAEEEVIEKKPQQRTSTTKRTRAAEVHNLSERRRRDRINEKMKALQELIPNSNKADKASMLDEAIEYLKMLQIQLQMMSMRSGMGIPPIIPSSMQHLQVNGMGGMPHMGMGMGMGLGMGMGPMVGMGGHMGLGPMVGMGAMDMTGRTSHLMPHLSHGGAPHSGSPMMPHPSHGGASYNVSQVMTPSSHGGSSHKISATSPAVSMVDNDLRLQSNSALESVYLARQHQLQLTPQTMDVYNAYMLHQQQHQQQQQQQHQQHHQLHHMPSNMSGGGL